MTELLGVAVTTAALYATTFALVRVAGRRTVSRLSTFDVLVTIAIGSLIASAVVSSPPSYGRGAAAVATLLFLQVVVGALRQRVPVVRRALDFAPLTIYEDGRTQLPTNPLGPQLTPAEIEMALRKKGVTDPTVVARIVLEPDGTFSVLDEPRK